ncbi:hypothetical protein [Gordonia lacunae]|nr:hypothetical protein [Gordonia lacunae]
MKALVLTDRGEAEYVDLPAVNPERAVREIIGGQTTSLTLTRLAAHVDLCALLEPLTALGGVGHNDVATRIASAGIGRPRDVCGTAVITAHTHSGILTALSRRDCAALDRIIAEIYTGYPPPNLQSVTEDETRSWDCRTDR